MNYFLWSRIIYAVPIIIFMLTTGKALLNPESEGFLYAGTWGVMFLFSLIFFNIAKKEMPRLLVHFIFLAECFIYYNLAVISGQSEMMLMGVVLSAFYAIDSLRNSIFSIGLLLLEVYAVVKLSGGAFGYPTREMTLLVAAPLFCRALMSSIDERNVDVREQYLDKFVPMEDTTVIDKLRRKSNFFILKNKKLKADVKRAEKDKNNLKNKVQEAEKEAEAASQADLSKQQMNETIARQYFALLSSIRIDLSSPINENLDRILKAFALLTKAQYTAVIAKEPPINKGESYSLALTNSFAMDGFCLNDETVIENEQVWNDIIEIIDKNEQKFLKSDELSPIEHIILTPISGDDGVKGVLIQGFGKDYVENIHNYNIARMVAYQLYTAMENEVLYKQSRDGSNIDALTGVYNKKFLMNSLPVAFNSAFNYSTNLACVFVAEDKRQGEDGIILTAKTIEKHIRKTDTLYRYSDNSFVVLFSGVTKDKLEGFADEINTDLANNPITLSVSMGVKVYDPLIGNVEDGNELLKLAAKALHRARQSGELGQIVIADN